MNNYISWKILKMSTILGITGKISKRCVVEDSITIHSGTDEIHNSASFNPLTKIMTWSFLLSIISAMTSMHVTQKKAIPWWLERFLFAAVWLAFLLVELLADRFLEPGKQVAKGNKLMDVGDYILRTNIGLQKQ